MAILPSTKGFSKQLNSAVKQSGATAGVAGGDAVADGLEKGAKKGSKKIGSILKTGMKGLGIAGLAAGAGAALASPFVNAASDAQQSIGATEALFGQYADTVVKKSKEASQAYGLSANEYRESSNLLAALFKNQGVEMDQLAGKTDEMVGLGADLAAMYGGTTADAVEAMTAAYKGEFNSLEKYGITMKASTVNAEAMAVANVKSAKEWNNLTAEQQAAATQQATTNLLLKQSTDAQGQAARESDTYAGQMQRLQASLANTKETLGTALLPVVSSFVGTLNKNVVPAIDGFISGMKDGTGWGGKVADTFGTIKDGAATAFDYVRDNVVPTVQNFVEEFKNGEGAGGRLRDVFDGIKTAVENAFDFIKNDAIPSLQNFKDWLVQNKDAVIDVAFYVGALGAAVLAYKGYVMAATAVTKAKIAITKAWTAITKAQTVAQRALNLVMKMNPIGLVIAAITGLIGILVVAYKRHEGFRELVDKVWAGIKNAAKAVVTWFKDTAWPWMRDAMRWIGEKATDLYKNQMKPAFDKIKSVVNSVVGWIKDTAWPWLRDAFNNMRDKATNLKDKAVSAFDGIKSGISKAWDGAKKILDKFKSGLQSVRDKFTTVKDGIANVWGKLVNAIARPINSVIDKINSFLNNVKNGLNKIPGVDLKGNWSIRKIILDTATATVGYRGGRTMLASGGKVPGWSPHDRADNIPAMLTAGEYVLPVKATNRLRAMLGDSGLESLRRGTLPGYASGGLIERGTDAITGGAKWLMQRTGLNRLGDFLGGPLKWIKNLWNHFMPDMGSSWPAKTAKGIFGKISLQNIADAVLKKIAPAAGSGMVVGGQRVNYGGSYGWAPRGMGWSSIWNLIKAVAPEAIMTSNYRPGAITASGIPSLHGQGRAVDVVSGNMAATFRKIKNLLPWSQLYYTPMGGQQIGYRDATVARTHWDHIHAAFADGGLVPSLYDRGGMIQPGVSLVSNQTGRPEMVLTNDQWTDIREGQGNTIVINGVNTDNATDVADELLFAMRRTRKGKYNRVR